jgi:hypothetical protein
MQNILNRVRINRRKEGKILYNRVEIWSLCLSRVALYERIMELKRRKVFNAQGTFELGHRIRKQ